MRRLAHPGSLQPQAAFSVPVCFFPEHDTTFRMATTDVRLEGLARSASHPSHVESGRSVKEQRMDLLSRKKLSRLFCHADITGAESRQPDPHSQKNRPHAFYGSMGVVLFTRPSGFSSPYASGKIAEKPAVKLISVTC